MTFLDLDYRYKITLNENTMTVFLHFPITLQ